MIETCWLTHESPGLKPDWLSDIIKLFSIKDSNIQSHINLSRILSVIGSNDIGR